MNNSSLCDTTQKEGGPAKQRRATQQDSVLGYKIPAEAMH